LNLNSKNQARGRLIIYNTTNSITTLKKNCKCKPFYYFLNFEKEMNNMLNEEEKENANKRPNIFSSSTSNFFDTKEPFKKDDL